MTRIPRFNLSNISAKPKFEDIQPEAVARAKLAVLDIIAVSLGCCRQRIASKARAVAGAWGGREESRVFSLATRCPRTMLHS